MKKSKGEIILFLDSDDFFEKKKIETVIKSFESEKESVFIMDKPYIYFDKRNKFPMKIKERNQLIIPWPKITSQSCISVKKVYLEKILNKIQIKKFPNIWFDFRLSLQVFLDFKKLNILNKHLTISLK